MIFKLNPDNKNLAIGLMSGTSGDGVDAALIEITGCGTSTKLRLIEFITLPFSDMERERILRVAKGDFGGSSEICSLNFYLGELSAAACCEVLKKAGVNASEIAFVGSHGQTVFHSPAPQKYLHRKISSTLQIGEPSIIAERLGCPVVSDFRVRDMAAGGLGAPLVPYTEFLLYSDNERTIALQNIGGIGNITLLPKGCSLSEVLAFDTGPGNMVIDSLAARASGGRLRYDEGGAFAAKGNVSRELLEFLLFDPYLDSPPPKTTGREMYGEDYVAALCQRAEELGLSDFDTIATATRFTAETIRQSVERFCPIRPERLIVGGGGSMNKTLMREISDCLNGCEVITNEQLGLDSNAKEAMAFAVLANETLNGRYNNAPGATGASHPVVMGKISL